MGDIEEVSSEEVLSEEGSADLEDQRDYQDRSPEEDRSKSQEEEESPDEYDMGSESDSSSTIYMEKLFCTVCNVDMPIRAKHCKECGRCVGLYDHHCPWLGKSPFTLKLWSHVMPYRNLHRRAE